MRDVYYVSYSIWLLILIKTRFYLHLKKQVTAVLT